MKRLQFHRREAPGIARRGVLLLGLQIGAASLLGWRMRQLQVENSERYRLMADENRINIRLIPPKRGLIFDRNGKPLAINRQNYRIVLIREQSGAPEAALDRLATILPITEAQRARVLKEVRQKSAFVPVTVVEHLDFDAFARVAFNAPALPGIVTEVGLSRFYPEGEATAHVVGYVGPVSEKDLADAEESNPLLQIPRFQIGKSGIEKLTEASLRGEAGISRIEVNSVGRVMRELDRTEGTTGTNLQLTLDLSLQKYALERMKGESAAAVLLEIATGDVLALASSPVFDPNLFVFGISTGNYSGLLEDPYRPLANKTVSGAYPPGSTFKMVVALAALSEGLVTPTETVFCPGSVEVGNRRFHCWRRGGHGQVNLRESLKSSCDVFYYEMSRRLGIDKISEMARKLGLGIRHDLPLPAITEGMTPTKEWKQRTQGKPWVVGDTVNCGIGQGYVLASPLQLAVMTARIASGRMVEPRLVRATDGTPAALPVPPALGIEPHLLASVQGGMFAVTNDRHGTAWKSRIADEAFAMAGKTGTSQVRQISEAERRAGVFRNEDLPWNRRDHALFVGYAPVSAPRYAISIIVEHGGGGSTAAAPIARDILLQAMFGGPPPLTAYPPELRPAIEKQRAVPDAPASISPDPAAPPLRGRA